MSDVDVATFLGTGASIIGGFLALMGAGVLGLSAGKRAHEERILDAKRRVRGLIDRCVGKAPHPAGSSGNAGGRNHGALDWIWDDEALKNRKPGGETMLDRYVRCVEQYAVERLKAENPHAVNGYQLIGATTVPDPLERLRRAIEPLRRSVEDDVGEIAGGLFRLTSEENMEYAGREWGDADYAQERATEYTRMLGKARWALVLAAMGFFFTLGAAPVMKSSPGLAYWLGFAGIGLLVFAIAVGMLGIGLGEWRRGGGSWESYVFLVGAGLCAVWLLYVGAIGSFVAGKSSGVDIQRHVAGETDGARTAPSGPRATSPAGPRLDLGEIKNHEQPEVPQGQSQPGQSAGSSAAGAD
jgi:hypothetical protein